MSLTSNPEQATTGAFVQIVAITILAIGYMAGLQLPNPTIAITPNGKTVITSQAIPPHGNGKMYTVPIITTSNGAFRAAHGMICLVACAMVTGFMSTTSIHVQIIIGA
jgi:hypothetical protein